ncbi:hypothetical protein B0J12DRAFT_25264 [Macrophomina phaseolina]|uniref:Uncharacterized protein n=1 Tax=Macrophomina phaseolina TaxID=35725 RepID=A0ABQ8GV16_9PEZI|nr:hypothetical protein B0J12DRAFT_25264 [Macrophomina phaseolina]
MPRALTRTAASIIALGLGTSYLFPPHQLQQVSSFLPRMAPSDGTTREERQEAYFQRRKIINPTEIEQRKNELLVRLAERAGGQRENQLSEVRAAREALFERTRLIIRYGYVNCLPDEAHGNKRTEKSEREYCYTFTKLIPSRRQYYAEPPPARE